MLALVAAAYALPIALPVIVVTEIRGYGDWRIFAAAGTVLGVLLVFLFAEVPFEWLNLLITAPLVPLSIFAALIYWAIAWKWASPKAGSHSPRPDMPL
jgi:hypothetical protein